MKFFFIDFYENALNIAIQNGETEIVKLLLSRPEIKINEQLIQKTIHFFNRIEIYSILYHSTFFMFYRIDNLFLFITFPILLKSYIISHFDI